MLGDERFDFRNHVGVDQTATARSFWWDDLPVDYQMDTIYQRVVPDSMGFPVVNWERNVGGLYIHAVLVEPSGWEHRDMPPLVVGLARINVWDGESTGAKLGEPNGVIRRLYIWERQIVICWRACSEMSDLVSGVASRSADCMKAGGLPPLGLFRRLNQFSSDSSTITNCPRSPRP